MSDRRIYHKGHRNYGTGFDMIKHIDALEAENKRLKAAIDETLQKLDRDGAKPGWGVVKDWLREATK